MPRSNLINPQKKKPGKQPASLIYAASEQSADLRYATGFEVPDPVLWIKAGKRTSLVVSPLEFSRAQRTARVDQVVALNEVEDAWRFHHQTRRPPRPEESCLWFVQSMGINAVCVPSGFPLFLADALREGGITVEVAEPFFPQRECKSEEEINGLIRGQRQAEVGMRRAREILRQSQAGPRGILRWGNAVLTSERLQFEIDQQVRRAGGEPQGTIVAGGEQACDPHERGHGPLRAGTAIIIDIFPRDTRTGYHGDLTRTVIKGRAPSPLRSLFECVREGQRFALDGIRHGAEGKALQEAVRTRFAEAGHPTEQRGGRWFGFFHGLGHGLGLEVHEAPRIAAGKLKSGQVVTVEPGLYEPGLGGVRLEDVVVVEPDGHRNLTRCPLTFEIP